MRRCWTPAGRGGAGFVFTDGAGGFRYERQGFRSDVFSSLGEANKLGWAQWQEAQQDGKPARCRKRPADKQPSEPAKPPVAGHKRRLTRAAAAAAVADQAAEPAKHDGNLSSIDGQCLTEQQPQQLQRPLRRSRRSKAAATAAPTATPAAVAATSSETVAMPARRPHSTPAKKQKQKQPRKRRQANKKAAAAAAAVEPDAAGPQPKRRRASPPAATPAAAAAAAASEGGCSNLITPGTAATTTDAADTDAGHAAAAKGAAAAATAVGTAAADDDAGQFPTLLALWLPGGVADSGQQLALSLGSSLGRGGFGEVFKVSAKAFGPNSLSELKLRGSTAAAAKQLLERAARDAGGYAGSSSSAGGAGSNSVTLALKLAQPFVTTSFEMQENFFYDSFAYQDHVRERAAAEFKLMTACAASPHIVTAFAAGRIASHDTSAGAAMTSPWLGQQLLQSPGILMELADQGDVELALIKPASAAAAAAAAAAQPPLPPLGPQPSAHELLARQLVLGQRAAAASGAVAGLGAREAQRVVRAAAAGLRDLHRMARHLHCDVKIGNLLVFSGGGGDDSSDSAASGGPGGGGGGCLIKLCDLGVAKKRTRRPTFGPVSGTKDWQAPEQAAPTAGRLDYCLDSWGLGLLVLGLRRGRRPFWWLQDLGVRPFAQPDTLAAGLGQPGCRYAQEEPSQPGSALGALELAFVRRCMQPSSRRPRPAQLLQDDPYLSEAYQGG